MEVNNIRNQATKDQVFKCRTTHSNSTRRKSVSSLKVKNSSQCLDFSEQIFKHQEINQFTVAQKRTRGSKNWGTKRKPYKAVPNEEFQD